MNKAVLTISTWDDKKNFVNYIPAWSNFMEYSMQKFAPTSIQLLEYNARYKYTLTNSGKDLLTELEFDTKDDLLMFLLRWS